MFDKFLFGSRLREQRQLHNLSVQQLGDIFSIHKGTVSNLERGIKSPSIELAVSLADYFFVSLDYLVGRSDDPRHEELMTKAEAELKEKLPKQHWSMFLHAKGDLPEAELPGLIRDFQKMTE